MVEEHKLSVRRSCSRARISRSYYYREKASDRDLEVFDLLGTLSEKYPRWGFREMFDKVRLMGNVWNHKRVHRVYCRLGLNLRRYFKKRLPKRKKRPIKAPVAPNECWAMDFTSDRLSNGARFRTLNILDELNREALGIEVDVSIASQRVIRTLEQIIEWRGIPKSLRLDNGPEFISDKMEKWAEDKDIELKFIQPGKPTQNPFIERFNGSFRHEFLNPDIFDDLDQARESSWRWMIEYNEERPRQALRGLTPALFLRNHMEKNSLLACGTNSGG